MTNYQITVSPSGINPQTTNCAPDDTCTFISGDENTYPGTVTPHHLFKHNDGTLSATPGSGTTYTVRTKAAVRDYALEFTVSSPPNTPVTGTIHVGSSM
jgi:hypothetical protein